MTSIATIGEVAAEIERCLTTEPPDRHQAVRWVAQLMVDFEQASNEQRGSMVREEPASTGDQCWDALVAGAAEHLCFHHGLPVPAWSWPPVGSSISGGSSPCTDRCTPAPS